MSNPLQVFLGFAAGFGLWEALNVWLGDAPFALGSFAADVLGTAAIATVLYWAFERYRARSQA